MPALRPLSMVTLALPRYACSVGISTAMLRHTPAAQRPAVLTDRSAACRDTGTGDGREKLYPDGSRHCGAGGGGPEKQLLFGFQAV